MRQVAFLLPIAALAIGCTTTYKELRLRPVDTTSQRTVEGVAVTVNGKNTATTDSHGIATVANLRNGDTILLTKDGYEPAKLKLGIGEYIQTSPATDSAATDDFSLTNEDAIPVPLHRHGAVRRP